LTDGRNGGHDTHPGLCPVPREPLVLASASPRRAELLRQVGVAFEIIISDVAEDAWEPEAAPAAIAVEHARRKALVISARMPRRLVLGADTVVVLDGHVLGKPQDEEDAARMLKALSGRSHDVITGVALALDAGSGAAVVDEAHAVTEVVFRELSDEEVHQYVLTGEPMDKAGAYGIQGCGALLVREIKGCYSNVVGLPLSRTWEMLRAAWDDRI
jgi:septum formation protein